MSYDYRDSNPIYSPTVSEDKLQAGFAMAMARVYGLMMIGLLLTGTIAFFTSRSETILSLLFSSRYVFLGIFVVEIAMVLAIGAAIRRLSPAVGLALFLGYAALNGVTMAAIFLIYTGASIALTFTSTAFVFGVMSVIGFTTKQDLTSWGKFLLIGLIALIGASVLNFFLASSALDWVLTYAGIALFLGLTMYHTQRIKNNTRAALASGDETMLARVSIMGALALYLDFINLFLRLLRLFGKRR